jgi:hypothetical protein
VDVAPFPPAESGGEFSRTGMIWTIGPLFMSLPYGQERTMTFCFHLQNVASRLIPLDKIIIECTLDAEASARWRTGKAAR